MTAFVLTFMLIRCALLSQSDNYTECQMLSAWEYLTHLRQKHVYTNKQLRFLSHIIIYVNNLRVYKVAVFANPSRKNGKRYGVHDMVTVHTKDNNPQSIDFPQLKKELDGSDIDKKILMYDVVQNDIKVYDGEGMQPYIH